MTKILWVFFLIPFIGKAQLSEQATISVLTLGPYPSELYSTFGHSAFRIHDPVNNINVACNYGTFDLDGVGFYLNFALGRNLYKLSIEDYQHFENRYIFQNRFIHEQILNLTSEQKQKIFAYVKWNSLPENESYLYDYFYNNCSTKIRDVLLETLGDDVKFDKSHITTDYSIRDLTDLYLDKHPWGDLGIDVCLGLPMDKKASPLEYMFLPDFVESGVDHATISQQGSIVPLVKEKKITYEARAEETPTSLSHPLYVSSILALIAVVFTIWDVKRQKASNKFDFVLFGLTGLVGILLIFLWFFTNHQAAAYNFNLLWAFPLHVISAVALRRSPKWLGYYFLVSGIVALGTLLCWTILQQQLHYALIPLIVALSIRAFVQFYFRSRYFRLRPSRELPNL